MSESEDQVKKTANPARRLPVTHIFVPYNSHRILFTKIFALTLPLFRFFLSTILFTLITFSFHQVAMMQLEQSIHELIASAEKKRKKTGSSKGKQCRVVVVLVVASNSES